MDKKTFELKLKREKRKKEKKKCPKLPKDSQNGKLTENIATAAPQINHSIKTFPVQNEINSSTT